MRYHDMVYGVLGGMLWHFFCVISHICITKGLFFLCTNPYVLGPVHLLHNLNAHKYWEIFYCIQSMYWNTKCNPLSPYQHEATSWLPVYPRTKQLHASTWSCPFMNVHVITYPIQSRELIRCAWVWWWLFARYLDLILDWNTLQLWLFFIKVFPKTYIYLSSQ